MPIKNWVINALPTIIQNGNKSFYPLPTGRHLLKFWCILSIIEHFHIQYIKSFFLSKIKQNKDYFSSEKNLLKTVISEISEIKPRKLKEVYKADFNKFLNIKEDIFIILKEKFFNTYYNNIDPGLLALIEFVKIDFDSRGIYDVGLRDKKTFYDDILFLKLQNRLYELFARDMQETILDAPRVVGIQDIVIERIGEKNYPKYLLMYDPALYSDNDIINQHYEEQQNILQKLINSDEENNQQK